MVPDAVIYRLEMQGLALVGMSSRRFALVFALGVVLVPLSAWIFSALIVLPAIRARGRCPHCASGQIRQSWRVATDRMVPWLRPFRCEACLRRFYLLRSMEKRRRAASA